MKKAAASCGLCCANSTNAFLAAAALSLSLSKERPRNSACFLCCALLNRPCRGRPHGEPPDAISDTCLRAIAATMQLPVAIARLAQELGALFKSAEIQALPAYFTLMASRTRHTKPDKPQDICSGA
jgi:hypothetical protein